MSRRDSDQIKTPAEPFWVICSLHQLAHAQCYEFLLPLDKSATTGSNKADAFALNWHGKYCVYQNSCPHTGVNLNWQPDQFFDFESRFIQCGMHGALFEPASGRCVRGPCLAQSLIALPTLKHEENLCLDLTKLSII